MRSPATEICPASGRSRPPRRCSSVDLPEPERPTTATSSPARASRSAPSSTRRAARPRPYVFTSPRALTTLTAPTVGERGKGRLQFASKKPAIASMPPARTASKSTRAPARAAKAGGARARRPRARARRSPLSWRPRRPALDQHQADLAGLALVAAGVFLAFPLYLGWNGGAAGEAIVEGLTWAVGRVAYGAPVALVAAGALLVLRPVLPAVRPFRAGARWPPRAPPPPLRGGGAPAAGPRGPRRRARARGGAAPRPPG